MHNMTESMNFCLFGEYLGKIIKQVTMGSVDVSLVQQGKQFNVRTKQCNTVWAPGCLQASRALPSRSGEHCGA